MTERPANAPAVAPGVVTDSPPGSVPDPAAVPSTGAPLLNIANGLTTLRLLLVPVFVALLASGDGHDDGWRVAACVVFVVATLTDRIDGDIARSRNLVTEFGKVADPIADKALIGAALVGLSVLGDVSWWVTGVVLGREVAVTALRFWVIRHGVIPASRGGKWKAGLQALAIGLYLLPLGGWATDVRAWVMGVAVGVTIVTGVDYVARAVRLRRSSDRTHRSAGRERERT